MPLAAALALTLLATPPDAATTRLSPVTVEERPDEDARDPQRPRRLDLDELTRRRAATDIAEALAELPGVIARQRYNEAQDTQVQVRGFGARAAFGVRGLRVEYDGIPATAADGQSQLGHIDIAGGGRMTLVRGPFAALHGNGGAYLRVDRRGDRRDLDQLSLAGGSRGQWRSAVAMDAGEALRLAFSGNHSRNEGVRAHSSSERSLASARLDWELDGDDQFALTLHHQDQPLAQDPQGVTRAEFIADPLAASPQATLFGTRKRSRQTQFGARWQHALADGELSIAAYAGVREIEQLLSVGVQAQASPTNGGGLVDLAREYHGASLRWRQRASFDFADAEFSAELRTERLAEDRLGYENFSGDTLGVRGALRRDESNRARSQDAMLRIDLDPSERWRLSAGVRRGLARYASEDRYIRTGNPDDSGDYAHAAWLPVAGFDWRLSTRWRTHAAFGRTQELPTLAELAYREDGDGGFNAALEPARGHQGELGFGYAGERLRGELTLFRVDLDDEIVVDRTAGGRSSFRNAGATRREGLEFAFDWRVVRDWSLRGVGNWIDARHIRGFGLCPQPQCPPTQTVPAGRALAGVPRHSGRVELVWNPRSDWSTALELQALAATPASDRYADAVPGYAVWNLRLRRSFAPQPWGRTSVLLRVDNLFDRRYSGSLIVNEGARRYYEPAPGRGLWLGVDIAR
ncbi:MAG: TonB-dependent receptor [Xanthomonadales bacterium]|nr:TonB-dependent receptor [Xanthomonadales bacterium]